MKKITQYAVIVFLMLIAISAYTQKLPDKQTASVWAPATIKNDGKVTGWENQFQAYNNSCRIWYTVANDDDNLYLIVRGS